MYLKEGCAHHRVRLCPGNETSDDPDYCADVCAVNNPIRAAESDAVASKCDPRCDRSEDAKKSCMKRELVIANYRQILS